MLAAPAPVDRRLGDAAAGADGFHGQHADAALGEDLARRVEDRRTGPLAPARWIADCQRRLSGHLPRRRAGATLDGVGIDSHDTYRSPRECGYPGLGESERLAQASHVRRSDDATVARTVGPATPVPRVRIPLSAEGLLHPSASALGRQATAGRTPGSQASPRNTRASSSQSRTSLAGRDTRTTPPTITWTFEEIAIASIARCSTSSTATPRERERGDVARQHELRHLRREPGGRLVEEHTDGSGISARPIASSLRSPPLSRPATRVARPPEQREGLEHLAHPLAHLPAREQVAAELEVLADRQRGEHVVLLRHPCQPAPDQLVRPACCEMSLPGSTPGRPAAARRG